MSGESQKEPEIRPDPTVLTTEVINREVAHVQAKLDGKIDLGLAALEARLTGIAEMQDERMRRIEELLIERDRRYVQRFEAQQIAVDAAFAAQEKAVASAFESSEKAITKAEVSIEKRADSTYVTLNDLQRQLTSLMPRAESEQRMTSISEAIHRIEANNQGVLTRDEYSSRHAAMTETLSNMASRLDKTEGHTGGANIDRSLQALQTQLDANTQAIISGQGQKEGGSDQRNLMFAFVGFFATLLTIGGIVAAAWPN